MYNANCIREKQINQIERYGKCATITHGGSKELQWERCMQKMSKQLARTCHGLGLSQVIIKLQDVSKFM